ncbi:MAG TPA: class I SAM-dependent methyltransferase [Alphaproteobacteria bacterium]|nr:class I SAM-dependent methyltransferase [Alphaproteobacteria bacterium]
MRLTQSLLLRMFGRPRGLLGRLGGVVMARMNAACGAWVTDLLEVQSGDTVLEVGFGPGVVIERLARLAPAGHIAGIDPSREMLGQARARNEAAIARGRIDLRHGSVERLPFEDESFDKALAINSMQLWPGAVAGLREIRRVLRAGGRVALGFTPYSGRSKEGLTEILTGAGLAEARLIEGDEGFCALATKPSRPG